MPTITVLWYSGGSLLSRVIQFVTRSSFSHTAIVVDGALYEALGRGIVKHGGQEMVKRLTSAVARVDLPVSAEDERQVKRYLDERVGNGYSVLGLLAAGVQTLTGQSVVIALPGEEICSGLVARALQIAGYITDVEPRLETPASLAMRLGPRDVPYTDPELPDDATLAREVDPVKIRVARSAGQVPRIRIRPGGGDG